jgi:hypothetical protein
MNYYKENSTKTNKKNNNERLTAVCRNGGFSAFLETFVLVESSGIFSNFGAESPPLLQAAGRLISPKNKTEFIDDIKRLNPNVEVKFRKKQNETLDITRQ